MRGGWGVKDKQKILNGIFQGKEISSPLRCCIQSDCERVQISEPCLSIDIPTGSFVKLMETEEFGWFSNMQQQKKERPRTVKCLALFKLKIIFHLASTFSILFLWLFFSVFKIFYFNGIFQIHRKENIITISTQSPPRTSKCYLIIFTSNLKK